MYPNTITDDDIAATMNLDSDYPQWTVAAIFIKDANSDTLEDKLHEYLDSFGLERVVRGPDALMAYLPSAIVDPETAVEEARFMFELFRFAPEVYVCGDLGAIEPAYVRCMVPLTVD